MKDLGINADGGGCWTTPAVFFYKHVFFNVKCPYIWRKY